MKSYILVTLLLLKYVLAKSETHEEIYFDGFKNVREGLQGVMTREFKELDSSQVKQGHLSDIATGHGESPHQPQQLFGLDLIINNSTLDQLFAGLRLRFADKGPITIALPEDQDMFTVMLFNKSMDGKVLVYGGKIQGLESIHRTGDTELDVDLMRGEATFTTAIGLNDLSASYYGSLLLEGLGSDVGLQLAISHIELHVKLYVKMKFLSTEIEKLEIQELSFPQVGSLESHIKLTGILDPVINMVLDSALNLILGEEVFESLADLIKELINDMLSDTDVSSLSPYIDLPKY